MLETDSQHRRLSILLNPSGNFYTPTYPEGYCEGQAVADTMLGSSRCTFQRLEIQEKSFLQRSKWIACANSLTFDSFPKGWKIIEGRPWQTPKSLTPEQAREKAREILGSEGKSV